MSLTDLSASQLLAQLADKQLAAVEVAEAYLARIKTHDPQLGAYLRVDPERVLADAAAIDHRRQAGQPVGKLAGLPVAIKDVLATAGEVTTCGSRMLEGFVPPYDATTVARLKQAGAILLGKTNLDEFAMGGSTENSAFATTRNPWDRARVPGGSSGGSAAAVAGDLAPVAIGTDTGGSIRQPAAYCGVAGLKPTYGRVSRYGLVAFASSLDQVGPFARSVADLALLLEVLAGHDPRDATSIAAPAEPYCQSLDEPLAGLRLGLVREHFDDGLDAEVERAVREAVRVYEGLGARVSSVSLPHGKYGVAAYYLIAPSEASSNLARYDGAHYGYRAEMSGTLAELAAERAALERAGDRGGLEALDTPLVRMYRQTRAEGFGAEVKRRVMLGTYALSAGYYDAYYLKALKVRRLIRGDYDAAFAQVDLLIGPVTPTPAFRLGEKADDPLAMYLGDLYTVGANLAGIAALAIPCGFTAAGLPIGLHLQAPPLAEAKLLRAAQMFQNVTDWHTRRPDLG